VYPTLTIALPEWVPEVVAAAPPALATPEERMALAVALARENVSRGGGPFGAVIVEEGSGRVVAAGVNLVVPLNCSLAHAETVAIALAQQVVGSHNLGAPGMPDLQLVTSTEPCAMCLGAIPWSGISSILCGADADDAERIGFDEGDKPDDWPAALERRGIAVTRGVLKAGAQDVLTDYGRRGGPIYNGRTRRI